MSHILHQIFKTILNMSLKNIENTDNTSIRIYINNIENRTTFKIRTGCCLELLMPETGNYLKALKALKPK